MDKESEFRSITAGAGIQIPFCSSVKQPYFQCSTVSEGGKKVQRYLHMGFLRAHRTSMSTPSTPSKDRAYLLIPPVGFSPSNEGRHFMVPFVTKILGE